MNRHRTLYYNGHILTQLPGVSANSLAISGRKIIAVGRNLQHDADFKAYARFDLKGKTITPGFVDAHTHIYFLAQSLGRVSLIGLTSIDDCLKKIKAFAKTLRKDDWVVGEGYAPDDFKNRAEPDRWMLDKITGRRPAFIFSKDQHSAWVNSRALAIAGIDDHTVDADGGRIERSPDGRPSGILREKPAYNLVWQKIPPLADALMLSRWKKALQLAYSKGVTGVHSFDGPEALPFFRQLAEKGKLGLRINHYPQHSLLEMLEREKIYYGHGDEFFRIVGIKIFADGSLGSRTALCFKKYIGSKENYGIEVTSTALMSKVIGRAAHLGMPCAIHGIGDKAVANILDAFESSKSLHFGARNRIEHVQLMRRKDMARMKRLHVVASVQPSHCPSDIPMLRKQWGARSRNAYMFRSLLDAGIMMAFGSDAPIEPLDPLAGMAAAVRRARQKSRDVFHLEQRLTISEAIYGFTAGPAIAAGQGHCRGFLLPGYPADLTILGGDITRTAASRLYDLKILATILDGAVKFADSSFKI